MFSIDVLSGYVVCSVGALLGAVMLRLVESDDRLTGAAVRPYRWGLVLLGLALMPAALGPRAVAHPLAQLSLSAGTLSSIVLVSQGLARLQGAAMSAWQMGAMIAVAWLVCTLALSHGLLALGQCFAGGLTVAAALCVWVARNFVLRPRDVNERAIGLAMLALLGSAVLRAGLAVAYEGPPRDDLMYAPQPVASVYAVFYAVLPMVVNSLVLNGVNARLRLQLHEQASTDELTGLMTRRAARELAPVLMRQQQSERREVAVLMLDLDRFKQVNDNFGHATGDAVLRQAATLLRGQLRKDSMLARYGGEEFVAIVPVDGMPTARRVAERLRKAIEGAQWQGAGGIPLAVTISIGAALAGRGEDLDAALERADEALYRAKRDGRNQCQVSLVAA